MEEKPAQAAPGTRPAPTAPGEAFESPGAPTTDAQAMTPIRILFDALQDHAALLDRQTNVLAANQALARSIGRALSELLGRPLQETAPPSTAERRRENVERVFRSGRTLRFEDESEGVWYDHLAHPVFDEKGEVRHVALLARDITQRKGMEEALRRSEATTRSILKAAPIGIGLVKNRVFRWVNDRMCEMTGYAAEELIGRSARILYHDEEEFLRVGRTKYGAIAERGVGEVETQWRCRDGRRIEILLRSAPIHPDRPADGATFTALDLTARKRMEEEILKVQRLEALGTLAGGIAHDFNNLLTVILSCVSILRQHDPLEEGEIRILGQAEEAALRAKNLTQQLLAFARGGAPIKKTFALQALLRETADFALSGSRSRCEYEIPEDLWPVHADERQIRQVVQNLVLNAHQSMPAGGTIRIRADHVALPTGEPPDGSEERFVHLSIQDTGCGIPEGERSRIYDPFFTTKEDGKGLGLATAFSIVHRHGGQIRVSSEVGSGTTFDIYLPASREPLPAPVAVAPLPRRVPANILIVDDEAIVRDSTEAILRRLGYEVTQAADGAEGIERYREALERSQRFDAVIMDLTIPGGMGGERAVREVKRLDPGARVIVSSGFSQDPVMSRFEEYGFAGVLPKPYKIRERQEALDRVLSRDDAGA